MRGAHWRAKTGQFASGGRRVLSLIGRACKRRDEGSNIVEFALILPMMLTVVMGILVFGIAYSNYLMLTNATNMGAQALAISRGQTTNPCTTTSAQVFSAAPNLTQANLKFTIVVNPPAGSSSSSVTLASGIATPSCSSTTTTSGYAGDLLAGYTASVTVTYPCNLYIYNKNFAPNCVLTAQTSEVIQ